MVDVRLTYDKGLDRYYGLLELALKHGIFKSVSTRVGTSRWNKIIWKTNSQRSRKTFYKGHIETT